MITTFSSKPLGHYVDSTVEPFCDLEEQFGSHLEQMPRRVKLVLRSCLAHFLSLLEIEEYDPQEAMRDSLYILPPSAQELANWDTFLDPFWSENTDALESFLRALCEQLRLDD